MSQVQSIANHLREGMSLTPMEALEKFGCFRLAARIKELRELGHLIEMKMIPTPGGARVAQYMATPPPVTESPAPEALP